MQHIRNRPGVVQIHCRKVSVCIQCGSQPGHGGVVFLVYQKVWTLHICGDDPFSDLIFAEIEVYYGLTTTSAMWGQSVCMPYPAFLQWGNTFSGTGYVRFKRNAKVTKRQLIYSTRNKNTIKYTKSHLDVLKH